MSKSDDGGQAFPASLTLTGEGRLEFPLSGMTLRQWYAGMAMSGLLATNEYYRSEEFKTVAKMAFAQADAMIALENQE